MKAKKLTESIDNVINEDAYSKFTAKQLFTKLGSERFAKYLQNIVINTVRQLKIKPLENMVLKDSLVTKEDFNLDFVAYNKGSIERLNISYMNSKIWGLWELTSTTWKHLGRVDFLIEEEEKDIVAHIRSIFSHLKKDQKMNKTRKSLSMAAD